jgi:hypothetical protein
MFRTDPPGEDEVREALSPLELDEDVVFEDLYGRYSFSVRTSDSVALNYQGELVRSRSSRERLNLMGDLDEIIGDLDAYPGLGTFELGPFYLDLGRTGMHFRQRVFTEPQTCRTIFAWLEGQPGYHVIDKNARFRLDTIDQVAKLVTQILSLV